MQNTVEIEDKTLILNSIYHGDQTDRTIYEVAAAASEIAKQLRQQGKKVNILINLTDVGEQTAAARAEVLRQLTALDYDKIAMFGAKTFLKNLVIFLIKASGRSEFVMYFDDEKSARAWLLS